MLLYPHTLFNYGHCHCFACFLFVHLACKHGRLITLATNPSCTAAVMSSEKTSLITPPSFYVRPGEKSDIPGVMAFDQHLMKHSLRSTLEIASDAELTGSMFPGPDHKRKLGLVATSPDDALVGKGSVKASTYIVDGLDPAKAVAPARAYKGLLGYSTVSPYRRPSDQRKAYDRSAKLFVYTVEPDVLGPRLWKAVNTALIEAALARCRATLSYKNIVTLFGFRDDQPEMVALRDLFVELGFEQVGLIKEIYEKDGVLLDLVTLQIKA